MSEELKVEKIIEKMDLKILTPDIDVGSKVVMVPDINRPALQLAGFFDHFDNERVQIIGRVEAAYMKQMSDDDKEKDMTAFCHIIYHVSYIAVMKYLMN